MCATPAPYTVFDGLVVGVKLSTTTPAECSAECSVPLSAPKNLLAAGGAVGWRWLVAHVYVHAKDCEKYKNTKEHACGSSIVHTDERR